jgi:hypothetical protein
MDRNAPGESDDVLERLARVCGTGDVGREEEDDRQELQLIEEDKRARRVRG